MGNSQRTEAGEPADLPRPRTRVRERVVGPIRTPDGAERARGKLLGDTAAITALLDRLLHHAHVLKCGPRSWCTKVQTDLRTEDATK